MKYDKIKTNTPELDKTNRRKRVQEKAQETETPLFIHPGIPSKY